MNIVIKDFLGNGVTLKSAVTTKPDAIQIKKHTQHKDEDYEKVFLNNRDSLTNDGVSNGSKKY